MKNKELRLVEISEIIRNRRIGSQEELLHILTNKGYDLTQATLSRDLKILKVAKQPDNLGNYVYFLPEVKDKTPKEAIINGGFVSISFSGNLAVIKTLPGFANGIASLIDAEGIFEILGTIAGDDTILVITKEGVKPEVLKSVLKAVIPGLN